MEGTRATSVSSVVSAVRANLMMDLSLKTESTNPNCQMVANVITEDTAQSEQPSDPTPLCPRSNLSELVRGDAPLRRPKAQSTHCLQTQLLLIRRLPRLRTSLNFCLTALAELQGRFDIHLP